MNKLDYHKGKNLFVSSSIDGKIFLFDHRISDPVAKIHCHGSCIQDFKILPYDSLLWGLIMYYSSRSEEILSADDDGNIFLYDIRTQTKLSKIEAVQSQKQLGERSEYSTIKLTDEETKESN